MLEQTVQVINPVTSLIFIFSSITRIWENFTVLFIRFLIILHTLHQHLQLPSPSLKSQLYLHISSHSQLPPFFFSIPNYLLFFSPFLTTFFSSLTSQLPPLLLSIPNYLISFSPFPTTSLPSFHSQLPPFLLSLHSQLPPFLLSLLNCLPSFSSFPATSPPCCIIWPSMYEVGGGPSCMK